MTLANYSIIFLVLGALSMGCGEKKAASPAPVEEKVTASDDATYEDVFNNGEEEANEEAVDDDPYGEELDQDDDAGFDAGDVPDAGAGGGFNIGDAMGLIGPVMNAMKSGDIGSALGPILETMGGAGGGLGGMADLLPALTGLLGGQ